MPLHCAHFNLTFVKFAYLKKKNLQTFQKIHNQTDFFIPGQTTWTAELYAHTLTGDFPKEHRK